ncbi:MAG: hypothetical protein HFJ94_08310 [Muribaculaceae bacterium]|nr:hypothetical protein [Muribaculaceae bacterium]
MKRISQIVSSVFSPLLVPTYGVALAFWTSMLAMAPLGVRLRLTAIIFIITCLLPVTAIFLLYKLGVVKDPQLNERTDRTLPYIATALAYGGGAWSLWHANAPAWMWLFMIGGVAAVVVNAVVNRWWKISAHLAAMGGLIALVFRIAERHIVLPSVNYLLVVTLVVVAAGMVGTARIYLQRHTLLQVLAGALNGFLCVYIITAL